MGSVLDLKVIQPSGISDTNLKLGNLIHAWSITAGDSCPGESLLCKNRCYAKKGHFHQGNVKRAHAKNFEFSKTDEFASWAINAIAAKYVRVLRTHVAGDFYSAAYVAKWLEIVRAMPDTVFYAYTRSWRVESIFPPLLQLAEQKNFHMWWSIDRETGPAPCVPGIRTAYLAIDDVDALSAPDDVDLIFRDKGKIPLAHVNGVMVCPVENKIPEHHKRHTCSSCGVCFNGRPQARWQKGVIPQWQELLVA